MVLKPAFRNMWSRLTSHGYSDASQGEYVIAAAYLVHVSKLEVDWVKDKSLRTIVLKHKELAARDMGHRTAHDGEMSEFGDLDRIVADSNICSAKPTVRGARIMANNIHGMLAGRYDINWILKAYP